MIHRTTILLFCIVVTVWANAQYSSRPRVRLAGGVELGWSHNKAIGRQYHQNTNSIRYFGEVIYRYNGLNHLVISGAYSQDSLSFQNQSSYLTNISGGYGNTQQFQTKGLIKTRSAWFGGAWLLSIGKPKLGFDVQLGASGRYIYEAVRYGLPDETFEYTLKEEIQPFNIILQPKLAIRLSFFRFAASYEYPLMDHINHDFILEHLPYEHPSADMRGLRWDQPMFYLSGSLALPVDKAIELLDDVLSEYL